MTVNQQRIDLLRRWQRLRPDEVRVKVSERRQTCELLVGGQWLVVFDHLEEQDGQLVPLGSLIIETAARDAVEAANWLAETTLHPGRALEVRLFESERTWVCGIADWYGMHAAADVAWLQAYVEALEEARA